MTLAEEEKLEEATLPLCSGSVNMYDIELP